MVALETPKAEIGWKAAEFSLKGIDEKPHGLNDVRGKNGLLVVFMCNHCPYVQKQIVRINALAKKLQQMDYGVVAINSNDATMYPDDSFDKMQAYAKQEAFVFPYLYDETQEVARAYGAVCTPDFFAFNADLILQYRGRMDSSWSGLEASPAQEMQQAIDEIVRTGKTNQPQNPSIGCSIKWRM